MELSGTSLTDVERRVLDRFVAALRAELGDDLEAVWLYGSRARGEPGHAESDVDVLVVTRAGWRDGALIDRLAYEAAVAEGFSPPYLAVQLRDPAHIARKRAIDDFFMREVDRDKVVLAGST